LALALPGTTFVGFTPPAYRSTACTARKGIQLHSDRSERMAAFVSHVLNPAGLALGVFMVLTYLMREAWIAGATGVLLYAVMPGALLIYLHRIGFITELYPEERRQRANLLLLGALCYFCGYGILLWLDAPLLMLVAGCAFALNTLLVLWINRFWKISIHAVGVSGGVSVLLLAGGVTLWPALLALPLVAWARLRLRAHTPAQVTAGLLLGGSSTILLQALVFSAP
jgi:membrane-associated phospholipid phosphatase